MTDESRLALVLGSAASSCMQGPVTQHGSIVVHSQEKVPEHPGFLLRLPLGKGFVGGRTIDEFRQDGHKYSVLCVQ